LGYSKIGWSQKWEVESNIPWASQLLAFEIIELLDLSKANPQKWRKAETNAPKLSKRLKVNGANIDIE
jgi:hypothetical protein